MQMQNMQTGKRVILFPTPVVNIPHSFVDIICDHTYKSRSKCNLKRITR